MNIVSVSASPPNVPVTIDLLVNSAVGVLQPKVTISGGYARVIKIAGMAQAFNAPIVNGSARPSHNMHLHLGLATQNVHARAFCGNRLG